MPASTGGSGFRGFAFFVSLRSLETLANISVLRVSRNFWREVPYMLRDVVSHLSSAFQPGKRAAEDISPYYPLHSGKLCVRDVCCSRQPSGLSCCS